MGRTDDDVARVGAADMAGDLWQREVADGHAEFTVAAQLLALVAVGGDAAVGRVARGADSGVQRLLMSPGDHLNDRATPSAMPAGKSDKGKEE